MKSYWITGTLFGLVFAVLFSIRLGLFSSSSQEQRNRSISSTSDLPERDTWMNVIQNGQKIGYTHTSLTKEEYGYLLQEYLYMHINIMGLAQELRLKTSGLLNPDLTFSSFNFEMSSSKFNFAAEGKVNGNMLSIKTKSAGSTSTIEIPLKEKPFLAAGILHAFGNTGLGPGDKATFPVFDPTTMSSQPVTIKVMEQEEILNMGSMTKTTKVSLEFKGSTQFAWIGIDGKVIKESGLLGITLENTTNHDAISGFAVLPSQDLTKIASVPSNVRFGNPQQLKRLEIAIEGIDLGAVQLKNGRQILDGNILVIKKESLQNLDDFADIDKMNLAENRFIGSTPFIQSDHKKVKTLVQEIVEPGDLPLAKVIKLMDWIQNNIKRQPVLSVPDALSTLENRVGDCNEHAVLMAALARAAGIPAKVEAGLVYMNNRFYYHAWNLVYLGNWITADSVLNQIPADVTHIRFTSGGQETQLDLMGVIGNIKLTIISYQ